MIIEMKHLKALLLVLFMSVCISRQYAKADIQYIGKVEVSAASFDLSADSSLLEDGTPSNRLGGFGSAITWTGNGNSYIALSDRGPADGATSYKTRLQFFDIAVEPSIKLNLVKTVFLMDKNGRNLIGKTDADPRFDPEGICVSKNCTVFVSDEYGPCIYEFDLQGKFLRELTVPDKFRITHPDADPKRELELNNSGRQPNRGMEGLTITPDFRYLVGIMQSPLIQDGGLDKNYKRIGTNVRILRIDIDTGKTSEYLYPLDSPAYCANEIAAISNDRFLVIERDGKPGDSTKCKNIYEVSLAGATDISGIASLPTMGIPGGISAVKKKLYINLLDPKFGLAGKDFPEKIEGISIGPDIGNGRCVLLISSDNDFKQNEPSGIFAFAIDKPE